MADDAKTLCLKKEMFKKEMPKKEDLGFSFLKQKEGYTLLHHNKLATILRGRKALKFEIDIEEMSFPQQQQLMARLTGNYKRGNEKAHKF